MFLIPNTAAKRAPHTQPGIFIDWLCFSNAGDWHVVYGIACEVVSVLAFDPEAVENIGAYL